MAGSRSTPRSPAKVAVGRASWTSDASAIPGMRRTVASTWSVPRCRRRRAPSRGGAERRRTSTRSDARTFGSDVRTSPRWIVSALSPARFNAVRPPSWRGRGSPWTCTARTRTASPPGSRRNAAPTSIGPPRRLPVTTVPLPFTLNERSTARRGAASRPSRSRPSPSPLAAHRRRTARSSSRSATRSAPIPWPPVAETASTGASARLVPAMSARLPAWTSAIRSASTRSVLVTTTRPSATPRASSSCRCSTVCGRGPSSAATTSIAASISPAPTSMFPMRRS